MSLFWDWMYLFKKTPWDTGITPPEIVSMIESGKVPIGRALDLGCGTGTNAIYLAQRDLRSQVSTSHAAPFLWRSARPDRRSWPIGCAWNAAM